MMTKASEHRPLGFLPLSSIEAPVELYVTVASIVSKQPVLAHDTVALG